MGIAGYVRITLFRLKSDVLACCNTDNKEDGAFFVVESIVVVLLLSPSRASLVARLVDFDVEEVEVEPDPEVDEMILMVSSNSLSCSSLDELEASLSCVKTPAAELLEPAAIALRY